MHRTTLHRGHVGEKSIGPKLLLSALFACCLAATVLARAEEKVSPPVDEWKAVVEKNAPDKPTVPVPPGQPKQILVFSLFTGFNHTVIPYVDRVIQVLGKKSGTFQTTVSRDIESLAASNLAKYDVLVLNNNCSVAPRRNLLLDEFERNPAYQGLTAPQREAKSDALEQSMLGFVRGGKGLVVIHGAPSLLNNSPAFTEMVGGAFDYHPKNQQITLRPVDSNHPLVAAFRGQPFVHRDEPYCFKGAYEKMQFRPLLVIDPEGIDDGDPARFRRQVRYAAWVKRHGEGRVFYCSPGHFEATYESPTILRFLLDGIQYAAGDLKCDDRPLAGKL
jgi:type 1 glutamine amidotransferase